LTYSVIPQSTYERTESQAILRYVKSVSTGNNRTGIEYLRRLFTFEDFIKRNYSFSIDELLINKTFTVDVYDLLSSYVSWLKSRSKEDGSKLLSNVSIKNKVINAKNFLEFFDIAINPHKFKLRVKVPRIVNQYKEELTRKDIIKILETCESYKLKTYLICLAVTGCRASEMCSLRLKDIDWDENKINIRGEFTKTKVGRYCFITNECKEFLKTWIEYKYRRRRLRLDNTGSRWVTPNRRGEDLVFSSSFTYDGESINASKKKIAELDIVLNLYTTMVIEFNKVIRQLNIGYEDDNKNRHVFTLHSFRRYVRTLISDLGYQDYAEFTLGHSNSTYWRKSTKEKHALFKRIESHLLLLDQTSLERKGADIQTKLEERDKEIADIRSRFDLMQSQIHSLLSSLGNMQDQNQVNQMAKTLYNSRIIKKED
jgi:integrase